MIPWAGILIYVKILTAVWALLVLGVTAGFQASLSNDRGLTLDAGSAILAATVLIILYFPVYVFLTLRPIRHVVTSVLVDTVCIFVMMIILLGGIASFSQFTDDFSLCDDFYGGCGFSNLGLAVVGLGWVLWILMMFLFFFQLIYILVHFPKTMDTWTTNVHDLLTGYTGGGGRNTNRNDVESKLESDGHTTTGGYVAPVAAAGGQGQSYSLEPYNGNNTAQQPGQMAGAEGYQQQSMQQGQQYPATGLQTDHSTQAAFYGTQPQEQQVQSEGQYNQEQPSVQGQGYPDEKIHQGAHEFNPPNVGNMETAGSRGSPRPLPSTPPPQ